MANNNYSIDDSYDAAAVDIAISALRNGDSHYLLMYSDDYIRQYANDEDYDFWISEKERMTSHASAA